MKFSRIELRRLAGTPAEVSELQRVLEDAPGYALRVSGRSLNSDAAESTLSALPPGKTLEHKYVIGIFEADRMIGCVDLIRGYPEAETAMLGLLLLSEKIQGRGVGKSVYEAVETIASAWPEITRIRM